MSARLVLGLAWIFATTPIAAGDILWVGPGRALTLPSQAAAIAQNGDRIFIEASVYRSDVAVWTADDLLIRGIGGRAHLMADGQSAQGKAIWVIQGKRTVVEYIEFSGATVPDGNGAGIRAEGTDLTVRRCSFHDNENGILTGADAESDILIEHSEFAHNGLGDGFTHNLYVGHVRSLTFRYNRSHHARIGHHVKTRALENHIAYNRIMDEAEGTSSYLIDVPDGGETVVIGNVLHQGENNSNSSLLAYALENGTNPIQELFVINNTMVNDALTGTFVRVGSPTTRALVINNLLVGAGKTVEGSAEQVTNLHTDDPGFVDRPGYDYRLTATSPAINQGSLTELGALSMIPDRHYREELSSTGRVLVGPIDIGANELDGSLRLELDGVRQASYALSVASGLDEGDWVFFVLSFDGIGDGGPVKGALRIDLLGQLYFLGLSFTDASGVATLSTYVPGQTPPIHLHTQAIVARVLLGDFHKTNTMTRLVLPK